MDHATLAPLVWSTSGGAGQSATAFVKRVASKLAEKGKSHIVSSWVGLDAALASPYCAQQLCVYVVRAQQSDVHRFQTCHWLVLKENISD